MVNALVPIQRHRGRQARPETAPGTGDAHAGLRAGWYDASMALVAVAAVQPGKQAGLVAAGRDEAGVGAAKVAFRGRVGTGEDAARRAAGVLEAGVGGGRGGARAGAGGGRGGDGVGTVGDRAAVGGADGSAGRVAARGAVGDGALVREAVLHVVAGLAAGAARPGALVGAVVDGADDVEQAVAVQVAGARAPGHAAAREVGFAALLLEVVGALAAAGGRAAVGGAEPLDVLGGSEILASLFAAGFAAL